MATATATATHFFVGTHECLLVQGPSRVSSGVESLSLSSSRYEELALKMGLKGP